MKKIDVNAIFAGVKDILDRQLSDAKEIIMDRLKSEVKLDSRYMAFSEAMDKFPEITEELAVARGYFVTNFVNEGTKDMKRYVPYEDRDIIKGRIAIMAPEVIYAHTLEEIADLVKI